ncbi:MAG TPA: hypothetical protein VFW00_02090 [Rhodocyclaceae bacterium]|nr:hypothetical protein [Rhodocyclaceae bacterium]
MASESISGKRGRDDGDKGPPKKPSFPSMDASAPKPAPKPIGRPRSFSDAARQSLLEAQAAEARGEGAFAQGYRYEASETMRLRNSGRWNFIDAQPPLVISGGGTSASGTRRPDLVVEHSTEHSLHLVDIKAGRDITHSVDQLKDLTNVGALRFGDGSVRPVSSLTVVTGVGSRDVDVRSLAQVHNYSRDVSTHLENLSRAERGEAPLPRAVRVPLRVRSNSMAEGTSLNFPEFMERRRQRMAPPAPMGPISAPKTGGSSGHGGGASTSFPKI